jgi:hypothetical protein
LKNGDTQPWNEDDHLTHFGVLLAIVLATLAAIDTDIFDHEIT